MKFFILIIIITTSGLLHLLLEKDKPKRTNFKVEYEFNNLYSIWKKEIWYFNRYDRMVANASLDDIY